VILGLRTDSNLTQMALVGNDEKAHSVEWESGRELADQLLTKITELLNQHGYAWSDLKGLIVFTGPGSFTGLRIGATVANTIAFTKNIPIVGTNGDDWFNQGQQRLKANQNDVQVIPEYGREPNITKPKR
jgi:tRNA threonylcarbamoyladenosine biosynthesis protein TsaB